MARGKVDAAFNEMFIVGERDVSTIAKIIDKFGFNDGEMNTVIVSHSNLAVEKFLKGYLIKNGVEVPKIHKLDLLYDMAYDKNNVFKNIQNECDDLNDYGAEVKYDPKIQIDENVAKKAVEMLFSVYNFDEIKKIREELKHTDKNYPQNDCPLADVINEVMSKK